MQRTLKEITPDVSMSGVFNFDGIDIAVHKDGDDIWFRGENVAEALGYKRTRKAIHDHVDADCKKKVTQELRPQNGAPGQRREMYMINEPGVYSLVFSSKLPIAKRFRNWVFRDVLPSSIVYVQYMAPRLVSTVYGT